MNIFENFNLELGGFANEILLASPYKLQNVDFSSSPLNTKYLNKQLRALIPIEDLRSTGSFFTCDELGDRATSLFRNDIKNAKLIFDPACGAGNLLITCSKKLPINKNSLLGTLTSWGNKLAGYDIHKEFIEAAKIRLILEAVQRGAVPDVNDIKQLKLLLPFIRVGDSLKEKTFLKKASHIIINPPYCKVPLPKSSSWGNGSGNSAALFLEECVMNSNEGTEIVAILPDVLRSGSRYKKWRKLISRYVKINLKLVGKFDAKTDVDVFLLFAKRFNRVETKQTWINRIDSSKIKTISNYFTVSTGPVVPYRDKNEGPEYIYISPGILAGIADINANQLDAKRKYTGTVFTPPFVVIRRTSSPSDRPRTRATIVRGASPVAVENHLVVLKPLSGDVQDCKELFKILADPATDDFLNSRIRCRHLTVSAIKEIPWIDK